MRLNSLQLKKTASVARAGGVKGAQLASTVATAGMVRPAL